MRSSRSTHVWDVLTPELRSRLAEAPHRVLGPGEVDELGRAGAREAHAVWFESRPGRVRQWATTWEFRRFVDDVRDLDAPTRRAPQKRWSGLLRAGIRP